VRCENVAPGVDAVVYGRGGRFEYDLVVRPGADVAGLWLEVTGATALGVDADGALVARLDGAEVRQEPPVAYQVVGGARRRVTARYETSERRVRVRVGAYDSRLPLVVDPTLGYSTYFGGSEGDVGHTIAVDARGFAYVAGETGSGDGSFFLMNPLQDEIRFRPDAYVAKFAPGGQDVVFSTFFGGNNVDVARGIAVDASGAVYVAGETASTDLPTPNGVQRSLGGGEIDAFVVKIAATGGAIVYGTYLGGGDFDFANAIAVGQDGSAAITGETKSADFPTSRNALQPEIGSAGRVSDAWVARLAPSGSAFVFSTYLGGRDEDRGQGVAVDAAGATYVTGFTISPNFPKLNPIRGTQFEGEAFVTKLDGGGGALVYSTYAGGSGRDEGRAIDVDASGSAYVAGITASNDLEPLNAAQTVYGGGASDAFVTAVNAAGTAFLYQTYFGGSGRDEGHAVAVDLERGAYFGGRTDSTDLGLARPIQSANGGGTDVFVASLGASGRPLEFASYLGGAGEDFADALAVDTSGNAYLTGGTRSTDFPEFLFFQPGGLAGGGVDSFVTKIVGIYELTWEPPDPSAGASPPPRFPATRRVDRGGIGPTPMPAAAPRGAALAGYKVYRSIFPNVAVAPGNLVTSVPPTQTTSGPTLPGGAFFVVTAVYDDGTESGPSQETSGGANEAVITSVTVRGNKLTATGERFTSTVQVFVDGIPFVGNAKVKKGSTRVIQKGALLTGQSLSQYIAARGGRVQVAVRNSEGGIATYEYEE
jgi:hypothetical protein